MFSSNETHANNDLKYYNNNRIDVSIPVISCIAVFMLVGSLGNSFVLFIFGRKVRKYSSYRLFVLTMACYDIVACTLGMPGLLVELFNPYTFYSSFKCKVCIVSLLYKKIKK